MDQIGAVGLTLGALLLGAASPGPSFVLVSRAAVGVSRRAGVAVALGLGVVSALFALLALLGLGALLHRQPGLFHGVALMGGGYLLYVAATLLRHAAEPFVAAAESGADGGRSPFLRGLAVQASNPKTIIVYGSVFSAVAPLGEGWVLGLPPLVLMVEAGWYGLVALVFSLPAMGGLFLRRKAWVDRAAGLVLAGLGLKTLLGALWALGSLLGVVSP